MSSTQVSHKPFEIRQYPEHAIQPVILYLHVGDQIPAAAAQTTRCWEVVVFGSDTAVTRVKDEDAARTYLEQLAQKAVA